MPEDWSNSNIETTYNVTSLDIELLKHEIGKRFPFYDMKYNLNTALFFCRIDDDFLEEKFDDLRKSLSEKGYIPMLRFEKGEHLIYVVKKPKTKKKPIWVNIVLLIATIFTTTLAGALQWVGIYEPELSFGEVFSKMVQPEYLWDGFLFFSIPLLLILGIHEMGHYYISKKHGLDTTLPYFIPLPPPFILGTFGALISTKEPIPDRKTLLDVGISGPLCGFLVAIPVCLLGLFFMQQNPIIATSVETGQLTIVSPLILQGLSQPFTIDPNAVMHPTLFAGWVGFFLTALNLFPVGQLDGGHVARALLKDKHKYISWAVIFLVMGLGLFFSGYFMFAFILLFLIGTQHHPPLNEFTPLDAKRKLLGFVAFIVFILCFAPIPIIESV
jgi:membrane-associated protease RseP (regulator of RpoE activity)